MLKEIKLVIPVNGENWEFCNTDLVLSDTNFNEQVKTLAGLASQWSFAESVYANQRKILLDEFDVWMAQKGVEVAGTRTFKSVKEKDRAIIESAPIEYQQKIKQIQDIEYTLSIISNAICKAISIHKDAMITLGANLRAEMTNGLTINK